jgi:Cu+-exporting ATPase
MTRTLSALAFAASLLCAAPAALACEREQEQTASQPAAQNPSVALASTTLRVESVTCSGCLVGIRKELTALKGVTGVSSGSDVKDVVVTFEAGKVSDDALIAAVKKAGYDAVVKAPAAKQS